MRGLYGYSADATLWPLRRNGGARGGAQRAEVWGVEEPMLLCGPFAGEVRRCGGARRLLPACTERTTDVEREPTDGVGIALKVARVRGTARASASHRGDDE